MEDEKHLWNAHVICDGKRHLTCPNCSEKYAATKTRMQERAQEAEKYETELAAKKAEAQERANEKQVQVFVIQTARGLLVRTQRDIEQCHMNDSLRVLFTANPTQQEETTRKGTAVMQDDEIVPVYEYHYTGSGHTQVGATEQTTQESAPKKTASLLQSYKNGQLRDIWTEKTQQFIAVNQKISSIRCGEIVAAILVADLAKEAIELERRINPFTLSSEEEALYDWLFVDENCHYAQDLQSWSGTRTLLADTPSDEYTPEWMTYIQLPTDGDYESAQADDSAPVTSTIDAIHPEMDTIEREIVLTILSDAINAGYFISVHNDDSFVTEKSSSVESIFREMYSTGTDRLLLYQNNKRVGWILLIYGNGLDVVSDYSDNAEIEALLKRADELAEKYAENTQTRTDDLADLTFLNKFKNSIRNLTKELDERGQFSPDSLEAKQVKHEITVLLDELRIHGILPSGLLKI
jgi:hypothetical protein